MLNWTSSCYIDLQITKFAYKWVCEPKSSLQRAMLTHAFHFRTHCHVIQVYKQVMHVCNWYIVMVCYSGHWKAIKFYWINGNYYFCMDGHKRQLFTFKCWCHSAKVESCDCDLRATLLPTKSISGNLNWIERVVNQERGEKCFWKKSVLSQVMMIFSPLQVGDTIGLKPTLHRVTIK